MATVEKIRRDIEKTREKISEQQKRLRALEAQLTEEENLEIVRMVKAVKMDNRELTAFLKAYASGLITLPDGMMEAEAAAAPARKMWRTAKMRSKKIIRLFTAMLAVVLCTTAFAVPGLCRRRGWRTLLHGNCRTGNDGTGRGGRAHGGDHRGYGAGGAAPDPGG